VKNLKLVCVSALAVAMLAVAPCFVQASTITETASFSGATDWTDSLLVPQFNPSQGTLDSVTVAISGGTLTSTITVSNISNLSFGGGPPLFPPPASSSGSVNTQATLSLQDPLALVQTSVSFATPI